MKITKEELSAILTKSTANEISVVTYGEAKMNKKGNPFFAKEGRSFVAVNEVTKRTKVTYDFGGDYETRVNEALVADGSNGTFNASGLPWGEWAEYGKIIRNGEKLYIRVYINRDNKAETTFYVDGKQATDEQVNTIKEFTPEKKEKAKQANEGLVAEKQVIPNVVDFDKIESIEIDGVEYEL